MPQEIERKFLVKSDDWRSSAKGVNYRQGYFSSDLERSVRVRIAGNEAFLTIKGPSVKNTRAEFEYPIPLADAEQLMALCKGPLIDKTRFKVVCDGRTWLIDEYSGDNQGLILAETELDRDDEQVDLPAWVGAEVSADPRYYNANLATTPYSVWQQPS